MLTNQLRDRAGNALAAPPAALEFRTLDSDAPGAPQIANVPPAYACVTALDLQGSAEAGALIEVTGGAGATSSRAGEDGLFTVHVDLVPERLNHLAIVARDTLGNASPPAIVEIFNASI